MTPAKIGIPKIRLVTIWSILSEVVSFSPDFFTAAFTAFWIKAYRSSVTMDSISESSFFSMAARSAAMTLS